jgi:hypothetical protein
MTNENLSANEAAQLSGLRPATLAKMRCWGGGPAFYKLGRRVRYLRDDCLAWLAARRVRHTSEAEKLPRRLTEEPSAAIDALSKRGA